MTEDILCCPLVFSTASEPSIMFYLPEQAAYTVWAHTLYVAATFWQKSRMQVVD